MNTAKVLILAALSGGLLVLSFPFPGLWPLMFIALVPLLYVINKGGRIAALIGGWLAGAVFFGGLCYWVGIYGIVPWVIMAFGIAIFMGAAAAMAGAAKTAPGWARMLLIPGTWIAVEILRAESGVYSYPFGVLGYAAAGWGPALGLAALAGVYAVSFIAVFVNVGIYETWAALVKGEKKGAVAYALATLAIAGVVFGVGAVARAGYEPGGKTINVAVAQTSVRQEEKWLRVNRDRIMNDNRRLVKKAASTNPDIIVLPEAAVPAYIYEDNSLFKEASDWAARERVQVLAGVPMLEDGKAFNRAVLFDSRGKISGRYAKMIPVLFGETVPLRGLSERIYPDLANMGDITPGSRQDILTLKTRAGDIPAGVLICSESMYQAPAKRLAGTKAAIIFVLTNDAWFYSSNESALHADMTRMRAAETGKPIVQTANNGISAVFDGSGRLTGRLGLDTTGVLSADARAEDRVSVCAAGGWVFAYLVALISVLVVAVLYLVNVCTKTQEASII